MNPDRPSATPDWGRLRRTMVESQLRTVGVSDVRLLGRFATVPRERFLPDAALPLAYADAPVPLGGGRALNPPMATALMLEAADPRPSDRTLLIAAATGYAATILAPLVGQLVAVEEAPFAADLVSAAAGQNWLPVTAPLTAGAPDAGPYDLLFIDGAVEGVPDALVAQLTDGGRIATGVLENGVGRLCVGRKVGGVVSLRPIIEASVVPLAAFARPAEFVF